MWWNRATIPEIVAPISGNPAQGSAGGVVPGFFLDLRGEKLKSGVILPWERYHLRMKTGVFLCLLVLFYVPSSYTTS